MCRSYVFKRDQDSILGSVAYIHHPSRLERGQSSKRNDFRLGDNLNC